MSDYQQGRTTAIYLTGTKVEDIGESYEKDSTKYDFMKSAYGIAGKQLEDQLTSLLVEAKGGKVSIKDAEYGKIYISKCIDVIRTLFNDAESRRLQAIGANEAIKKAVATIKKLYDEENSKLNAQEEWEKSEKKDLKLRPVGAHPGNPMAEYKKQVEKVIESGEASNVSKSAEKHSQNKNDVITSDVSTEQDTSTLSDKSEKKVVTSKRTRRPKNGSESSSVKHSNSNKKTRKKH